LSTTQEEELARLYRMSNPKTDGFADSPRRANERKCVEPGGKNTKLHLCAASVVERHSTLVVHELKREGKTHKQLLYAQTAQSEADMLIASGFQVRTPNQTQQDKLRSLTAGQISQIQTRKVTLYVYPDWLNRRVLIGGPRQYQAYQQYRQSRNLPAKNPPQVYHGPSSFDWSKWHSG
jgi:hypothetical protein